MILLPGTYMLSQYVFQSNDNIIHTRISEISNSILLEGKKMYFYGPPSKSVIDIDFPSGIEEMAVMNVDSDEYFLMFNVITSNGIEKKYVDSDYPIEVEFPVDPNFCGIECEGTCNCFNKTYFSPGLKHFKIEASEDCYTGANFCVKIDEISHELAK